jgi:hypothetical protein
MHGYTERLTDATVKILRSPWPETSLLCNEAHERCVGFRIESCIALRVAICHVLLSFASNLSDL